MSVNPFIVIALLPITGALVACGAPSARHTPADPDRITVHCNKSTLRWNTCYEAAARLCGEKGYQIVNDDDADTLTFTTNANEVPVIGGSMVIRCNK